MAGLVKGFGLSFEQVMYRISFANLMLLGATLPSYDSHKKSGTPGQQEVIDCTDPRNKQRIRDIFSTT